MLTKNFVCYSCQKFHDDLDDIKKALLGADKNFRDIIDRGYMTDPDGFRDQVRRFEFTKSVMIPQGFV